MSAAGAKTAALPMKDAEPAGSAADGGADLVSLGAAEAVAHMSQGAFTSERYAEALLARCRSAQALNAFITLDPARVLEDARARDRERLAGAKPGPLFGLPIPVKDSVNTREYPTTGGTPALRHFRPAKDAPVVASLRAAGRPRARQDESARTILWLDQQQSGVRRGTQPLRSCAHSRRQQRRNRGRRRRPAGSARHCRRY